MSYPEQFGQPCWTKTKVEKCISKGVANIREEHTNLFLSSHSPIENISDRKAGRTINEEEAFRNIFSFKEEFRGVVLGGSGTGKSHLIRWLNIRAEKAAQDGELGLDQFKIVMVERDNGSLRSALRQISEQLGDEFEQLKKKIETTVDRFSDTTSRVQLLSELTIEVANKWEERGEEPLDDDLEELPDVLRSPGVIKWLTRDEGVIAQTISRFTEKSTIEERESQIKFTREELPKDNCLRPSHDSQSVYEFVLDLESEGEMADLTVKVINKAFLHAKREFSGINGNTLNEIFSEIRKKLKKEGKQLVVFVEDVTAASSGLDFDFYQAFEPSGKTDQCRMIALLGMTEEGWTPLPDNEKDRVQMVLDIGNNAENWANNSSDVAKFAARYLNTIRSEEDEIQEIAMSRLGSDVNKSKCDACPFKIECHDSFGAVELEEGTKVGLFPFSLEAPAKLLRSLSISDFERHRNSPRGLLDYVMFWALSQSINRFPQTQFPHRKNFNVQAPTPPRNWATTKNRFLGGSSWDREQVDRAQFLTEFWFASDEPDQVAHGLNRYRKALGIPKLSESVEPLDSKPPKNDNPALSLPASIPKDDKNLQKELNYLSDWIQGDYLDSDSKFRKHLEDFFKHAFKWEDYKGIPRAFALEIVKGNACHKIEGQRSNPRGNFYINYPRNDETHDLLEALVRFKHEGRDSWQFDSGEMHKRKVARWLRNNRKRVLETLHPYPPELTEQSLRAGIQYLALSAVARKGETLPKRDQAKRISELFVKPEEGVAHAMSNELNGHFEDIVGKWEKVKEFIVSELGIGQGSAAPTDYIDPLPILKNLEKFEEDIGVEPPDSKVNESFWQKRFSAVSKLSSYANLDEIFEQEKKLIEQRVAKLEEFSKEHGFDGDDLSENIKNCLNLILEIEEIQKASGNLKLPPDPDYNRCLERIREKKSELVNSVGKACEINDSSSKIELLALDTEKLDEIYNKLIFEVKSRLQTLESEMQSQLNTGQGDGDSVTKDDLIQELDKIISVIDQSNETPKGVAS